MNIQDTRYYANLIGLDDNDKNIPQFIESRHSVALELYRKRGRSNVPDDTMMMIAIEYIAVNKSNPNDSEDSGEKDSGSKKPEAKKPGRKKKVDTDVNA